MSEEIKNKKNNQQPPSISIKGNIGSMNEFLNPRSETQEKILAIKVLRNIGTGENKKTIPYTVFLNEKQYEITSTEEKNGKNIISGFSLKRNNESFKIGSWIDVRNAKYSTRVVKFEGKPQIEQMLSNAKDIENVAELKKPEGFSSKGFLNYIAKTEKGYFLSVESSTGISLNVFLPNTIKKGEKEIEVVKSENKIVKDNKETINSIQTIYSTKELSVNDIIEINTGNIPNASTKNFTSKSGVDKVIPELTVFANNDRNFSLSVVYSPNKNIENKVENKIENKVENRVENKIGRSF